MPLIHKQKEPAKEILSGARRQSLFVLLINTILLEGLND